VRGPRHLLCSRSCSSSSPRTRPHPVLFSSIPGCGSCRAFNPFLSVSLDTNYPLERRCRDAIIIGYHHRCLSLSSFDLASAKRERTSCLLSADIGGLGFECSVSSTLVEPFSRFLSPSRSLSDSRMILIRFQISHGRKANLQVVWKLRKIVS
jgi:hypothetical protein